MSYAKFDLYASMHAPNGKKHRSSSSSSSSAVSRKNKLQRCGVCGGLGHKARTCELGLRETPDAPDSGGEAPDPRKDPRTVLAAYGLLALTTHGQQQQMMEQKGDAQRATALLMRQQTQYSEQQAPQLAYQHQHHHASLSLPSSLLLPSKSPPCSPSGRLAQPWREPLSPRWVAT